MTKNNKGQFIPSWTDLPLDEKTSKFLTKLEEQRKEITNKEKYIVDPFVGYIKKRA